MKRQYYYNAVEERLNNLGSRISHRAKDNLTDLNIHVENFLVGLCNRLLDWNLRNANDGRANVAGYDLIDEKNKILVQVSSSCRAEKVRDSLVKRGLSDFQGYRFIFIFVGQDSCSKLLKGCYENPKGLKFNAQEDIWDWSRILGKIRDLDTKQMEGIYHFVCQELDKIVQVRIESILVEVLIILSQQGLDPDLQKNPEAFKINDKIIFNNLQRRKHYINEYIVYSSRLDDIYKSFDSEGINKSLSVLQEIRRHYLKLRASRESEEIFDGIVEGIREDVKRNIDVAGLSHEEINLCVDILVVDAFIRCKIFENPGGYDHVNA